MNESTHSGTRSKLGWIAFVIFCAGVATLAVLGIASQGLGPHSSQPTATPTHLARGR